MKNAKNFLLVAGDYLLIIRKKIWILGLIFILVVGLTAWASFRQSPVYQASCKIRYRKDIASSLLTPGSPLYMLSPTYYDSITFETEKYVIESQEVAAGVVETLGLASREESLAWNSQVRKVQGALSVSQVKGTRIYMITARSGNPDLAQALANTAAAVYIDFNLAERKESAQDTFKLLTRQIEDLKLKIKKSEAAKIRYLDEEGMPGIEKSLLSRSGRGGEGIQEGALLVNLRNQKLKEEILREKYLSKYKEKHPRVKEVERRIGVLSGKLMEEENRIIRTQKKAIEYGILQRESRANQELYDILIKKLRELDISSSGVKSNIEIIERAQRPGSPISPRIKQNLLLASILGIFLGIGAIISVSYFDPTIQTPEEVKNIIEAQMLTVIPRIKAPAGITGDERSKYISRLSEMSPTRMEVEIFRQLRTNIQLSDFPAEAITLLITSPTPGEGKTTIAGNLAITMARSGYRSVLVDADLRRPAVSRIFELSNEIGLSSYLQGKVSLDDIIQDSSISDLSIITSGSIPPNPSELLDSPRFSQLVEELKQKFDRIIFDSPPAGPLTDATIIGALMDGIMLVVSAGKVDKKFIIRTKHHLEQGGTDIYGVVLNNIEISFRSYNYYHQIYKYRY
ncbi:MAG: polysaccharide biosynthesis tyrosine autokinase [Candidatus Auribacterota bacterium]|nr:polysaccharide biosynthesis tyrosine autokinase [Candidatus Auribacterota bacterium]